MLTLEEVKERLLSHYDVDDLVEALRISPDDLLDRFEDKLITNLEQFCEELEEEEDEYSQYAEDL